MSYFNKINKSLRRHQVEWFPAFKAASLKLIKCMNDKEKKGIKGPVHVRILK